MKLLSDRMQEFIDWLNEMTDFGEWDESIKTEVHKKLITFMISDEVKEPDISPHEWEFYFNGTFCKKCGAEIGSGVSCK